jgi:hypothetical protein
MKHILIILLALSVSTILFGFNTPLSYTYGNSYLMRADGMDCVTTNPALFGRHRDYACDLALFSWSVGAKNNSISNSTLSDVSGKYLDQGDKDDLLDEIDHSVKAGLDMDMTILAMSYQNWGFHIGAHGMAGMRVSEDYLDLALNGNDYDTVYRFTKSENDARALSYADISFGMGASTLDRYITVLQNYPLPLIYVGYSLSYLVPLAGGYVDSYDGQFSTTDDNGIGLDQTIRFKSGAGGYGFKVMLSLASDINEHWSAGLSLDNPIGFLKFQGNTKVRYYELHSDSLYVSDLDEDLLRDSTYTVDASSFEMSLPTTLRLGGMYRQDKWNVSLDYLQQFTNTVYSSTTPRFNLCGEWFPAPIVPLRLAFSSGDRNNPLAFTYGMGLHFSSVWFDLGYRIDGSILPFWNTKGGGVSLSSRYFF